MFVQLVNPAMNRGLFPNLVGGEVGLDFGFKVHNSGLVAADGLSIIRTGVDIAAASYVGELNALGGMLVDVGNVSAESQSERKVRLAFSILP
jgi:phenylalanine ammonia-lyase